MTKPEAPAQPSLIQASAYWLKLGCISFGGPAGQIAMMHDELVERRKWISEKRFLHALNYCMVLPGPEAQQLATYVGWLMHRTPGALIAGGLFVLPSLLLLIVLTGLYLSFGTLPLVAGVLYAIKPAVVAIVLAAAWRIGSKTLSNGVLVAIAVAAFVAISVLHVPFPAIILVAALIGAAGGKWWPQFFKGKGHGGAKTHAAHSPALIDDDTPVPAHAKFSIGQCALYVGGGVALGLAAYLLLGGQNTLQNMGRFFTQAALLTFGGAYAVLPYVFEGSVNQYHWLNATQMMDGLALGESTPGPLIMIVAFVGFVGGWTQQLFGSQALWWAGAVGASVATFFTFLPSFIFILAGAPFIESTRDNLKLSAPLTAISAAVIGVIINLALFFGMQVFYAQGKIDWLAIVIALASLLALVKFKLNILWVLAACVVLGALRVILMQI